jgi:hypothetical protein
MLEMPILMTPPLLDGSRSYVTWQKTWNRIRLSIDENFPSTKNYVYFVTFGNYDFPLDIKIDTKSNIFLINDFDPPTINNGIDWALEQLGNRPNVYVIGTCAEQERNRYSFWAINCQLHFNTPKETELFLNKSFKYDFISYNRKPTRHRYELVKQLHLMGLNDNGVVTLGFDNSNYALTARENGWINSIEEDIKDPAYKESTGYNSIKNDIFSLGDLDVWSNHFVNVVSETDQYYRKGQSFLSEKIFKPILGLRPFIINGPPAIYQHLKENGFETFLDVWPIKLGIDTEKDYNNLAFDIATILRWLGNRTKEEKYKMYQQMYPALLANRENFNNYANNQWQKLDNIKF